MKRLSCENFVVVEVTTRIEVTRLILLLQEQVIDENAHLIEGILEENYELAEDCLRTNYYGAKGVITELLPLLQLSDSARIVNVTSVYGKLMVTLYIYS